MSAADPLPVLRDFLPLETISRIEPLAGAGGFSGSLLWRVTTLDEFGPQATRLLCLRRWPQATLPDRLDFIHQVLTFVAARGIDFVPVPMACQGAAASPSNTVVSHARHLWDLALWLPGQADFHSWPSRPRLAAAMHALARFHSAAETFRSLQPARGPALVFHERLDQVRQLQSGEFDRITAACSVAIDPALEWRAGLLLSRCRDLLPHLITPLEAASRESLALCPAIRDVHHDHLLFTDDRVTGLVDFGALRIDTSLADVARLVGSLAGDDPAAWRLALDAYVEIRPLSDSDRGRIRFLDQAGLILGALNWLLWLYVERRDMGPLPPILKRLDDLLARLQPR